MVFKFKNYFKIRFLLALLNFILFQWFTIRIAGNVFSIMKTKESKVKLVILYGVIPFTGWSKNLTVKTFKWSNWR